MPPTTMRYAGWLPPIHPGGGGWFPLKATSVAGIVDALAMVQTASTQNCETLVRSMSVDPALVVFTAARISLANTNRTNSAGDLSPPSDSSSASSAGSASLRDLASWWCRHGCDVWRETDWLAAPDGEAADSLLEQFTRLDDYFRVVPIRNWLSQADPWFEVAGIPNPVLASIQEAFRNAVDSTEPIAPRTDVHLAIRRWVGLFDESRVRNDSIADAVNASKRDLAHRLAYGLSHEINNPLANISTRAQSLVHQVSEPAVQDSLRRIVDQTSRAHAMIADLMFYANPPAISSEPFGLIDRIDRVIDSTAETASRLGINIEVCNTCDDESCVIDADAEMIGEAVLVLVRNAIEAIGVDGHIRIEITCDDETVQIAVADSGPGITAEEAAMAMDPYYSGREAGRGLGLGLCRADRIAGLHGGSVRLAPALAGCVATLTLPR
ncbi:sensor histidine kinase [Aporhodopirellula aestuarii]|uniref:histidine kinase n=1 Tax=Aporhodopirellula aestuarii TaxID=2950107 RepID=A0ABT0UF76_9BACT|nr:HAMP domain-containing sensor histidine kinase [Aporhodopirellula aestuarii]MCM2375010.1 HAMP domain-containing histidine kinase [Aporhodopirellula aestuarii]